MTLKFLIAINRNQEYIFIPLKEIMMVDFSICKLGSGLEHREILNACNA